MYSMIPNGSRRTANPFRFLDDFERSFFNNALSGNSRIRVDISEKDGNYMLEAELPGFEKNDINVELDGEVLTIHASHKSEDEEKEGDGRYIRRERRYGSYSRSFDVSGVDAESIKADYKNGVLELTLPKKPTVPETPSTRKIEIGG